MRQPERGGVGGGGGGEREEGAGGARSWGRLPERVRALGEEREKRKWKRLAGKRERERERGRSVFQPGLCGPGGSSTARLDLEVIDRQH